MGRYKCASPKLVAPIGVTAALCEKCYCRNHEGVQEIQIIRPKALPLLPCVFRGQATGSTIPCETCGGSVHIKLYSCRVYGKCTLNKRVAGAACCDKQCTERSESLVKPRPNVVTIKFEHGLGDATNFVHSIPLYTRRGYTVEIICRSDEDAVFLAGGAEIVYVGGTRHRWGNGSAIPVSEDYKPWQRNKNGCNLSRAPMFNIGTPKELWEEYCKVRLNLDDYVTNAEHGIVDDVLSKLPRPIIATHTIGCAWGKRRDYPDVNTVSMWDKLIQKLNGSILVIDRDGKSPVIDNSRIVYLRDFSPLVLYEALKRVDLLIGIDSGPLNFVRFTNTPAVGIWSAHYPSDYFLPRGNTLHVVGHQHSSRDRIEGRHWNTVLAPTVGHPSPEFMAETVENALRGITLV